MLLVYIPIMTLFGVLIGTVVFVSIDYGASYNRFYRDSLVKTYNRTQGDTNQYLDTLHAKFKCCGISKMQLNVDGDPHLFKPTNGTLTRLPKSCCVELDADDRCSAEHIYETPCDVRHFKSVRDFNLFSIAILISWLVWKGLFCFAYKKGSDSLFEELLKKERTQMLA